MKPSDNFVMAITPYYAGLTVDNEYYSIHARRKGINISLARPIPFVTVATEEEMWNYVAKEGPVFLDALAKSPALYHQALAKRADGFLNFSESYRDGMEAKFIEQMLLINRVVLEELDARVRSKKALRPHRTCTAKGVCWWEVKSNCSLPHLDAEPHSVYVRMFPSPLDETTWSVHVRMPTTGLASMLENQRRIKNATEKLAGMGITVADATQGSLIDL